MAESVHLNRRGVLFVLSSPSGAGKTTISRMMLEADKDIALSISATTRPPRPGEIDGVHYHFVDTETFKKMAADGEFLEWAHVFGHRYGRPRARVDELLDAGKDVLFAIDRPAERSGGKECVSTCRSTWSPVVVKKTTQPKAT